MARAKLVVPIFLGILIVTLTSVVLVNMVNADTLGPPFVIGSAPSGLVMLSPQNLTYHSNSILLNFTVYTADVEHDFGYSLDNGQIQRIANITKISEQYDRDTVELPPFIAVTDLGTLIIPDVPDGNHTLTLYYGFQENGSYPSFDIIGITTANFSIDTVSKPTTTTTPNASDNGSLIAIPFVAAILAVVVISFYLFRRHGKKSDSTYQTKPTPNTINPLKAYN